MFWNSQSMCVRTVSRYAEYRIPNLWQAAAGALLETELNSNQHPFRYPSNSNAQILGKGEKQKVVVVVVVVVVVCN